MISKKRWWPWIVQKERRNMRNDWILTPPEMALFIVAATCLAAGFVMAAGG